MPRSMAPCENARALFVCLHGSLPLRNLLIGEIDSSGKGLRELWIPRSRDGDVPINAIVLCYRHRLIRGWHDVICTYCTYRHRIGRRIIEVGKVSIWRHHGRRHSGSQKHGRDIKMGRGSQNNGGRGVHEKFLLWRYVPKSMAQNTSFQWVREHRTVVTMGL